MQAKTILREPQFWASGIALFVPAVFERRSGEWKPGPPLAVMHRRGLLTAASTP